MEQFYQLGAPTSIEDPIDIYIFGLEVDLDTHLELNYVFDDFEINSNHNTFQNTSHMSAQEIHSVVHYPQQADQPDQQRPHDVARYRKNYKRDIVQCFQESLQGLPQQLAVTAKKNEYLNGRPSSKISYNEKQFSYIIMASDSVNGSFEDFFANCRQSLINYANSHHWNDERLSYYLQMFHRCLISIQRIGRLSLVDRTDDNIQKSWRKQ